MKKIYLCIPYSFNPELSFKIANEVAAKLMSEGYLVFSPISHTHKIADHLPEIVRTDSEFWMQHDLPFVEWCDEICVVVIGEFGMDLIHESKGCTIEIAHAKKHKKTKRYINYDDY